MTFAASIIGWDAITPQRAAQWDALAAAAASGNVFFERWAVEPCLILPEGRDCRFLVVENGGEMIGLLPLQPYAMRGLPLGFQVWDQRVRALGEPLVRAGMERDFWQAALACLDHEGLGRVLRLSTLRRNSAVTQALFAVLDDKGRAYQLTRQFERAALHHGPNARDYVAQHIRGKVLKEHRRLRNRLRDRGDFGLERLAADGDIHGWIDDLFALEMSGWKGREGVAAAANPATHDSFRQVLARAHALGRLDFIRLALDGKPISMLATLETPQGEAFQLKIAFDEAFAAFSPGVLLEMDYLEAMLDGDRLRLADSCARPGHPMIDRIWVDRIPIVSLAIGLKGWQGRLAMAGLSLAKSISERKQTRTAEPAQQKAA